jgi:hypothetical protein
MNLESLTHAATIVAAMVAAVSAVVGVLNYGRSVRTRRAEWLASLHETFFGSDRFANIRRVLDYKPEPAYGRLVAAVTAETHDALADELYAYLNFFEFLGSLLSLGQIDEDEIRELFEYDLQMLERQHPFIRQALRPQGFENLDDLLQRHVRGWAR